MDSSVNVKSVCMNAAEIDRAVTRMAHQILEANENLDNLVLVGIVTRGDVLAERIARAIEPSEEHYKAYAGGRERYAALYQTTKGIMHSY